MRIKLQRSMDSEQPYYFEIQAAGNSETLATSETYSSKADAQRAIDLIKSEVAAAQVYDEEADGGSTAGNANDPNPPMDVPF